MTGSPLTETIVAHGKNYHVSGGSIGGVNAYVDDDGLPTVILAIMPEDGESFRSHLREGDTFELGAELWQVTEIKRPNSPRWMATVTQVEKAPEAGEASGT